MNTLIVILLVLTTSVFSNNLMGTWIGECSEGSSFFDWKNTDEYACRKLIVLKDTIKQQYIYLENEGRIETQKGELLIKYSIVDSSTIKLDYQKCEFLGNITTCPDVEVVRYSIDTDKLVLGDFSYYRNKHITDEQIKDNWLHKGMRIFLWVGFPLLLLFGAINQSK